MSLIITSVSNCSNSVVNFRNLSISCLNTDYLRTPHVEIYTCICNKCYTYVINKSHTTQTYVKTKHNITNVTLFQIMKSAAQDCDKYCDIEHINIDSVFLT